MSWDILPKSNLQYFLQKLKAKFDGKADNSEVTETDTPNNTPFLYRETPYEADRVFLDELVGGSVAWNQLVQNGDFADGTNNWAKDGGAISVSDGVLSLTANAVNNDIRQSGIDVVSGHKYLVSWEIKTPKAQYTKILLYGAMSSQADGGATVANTWCRYQNIVTATATTTATLYVYNDSSRVSEVGDLNYFRNIYIIDLTQMFGTTIADYIYSLEQATAGSGIAWLKSHGFFTKSYYPYNAGELISVKTSGKKYVGFNQNDEIYESGLISVSTGADISGSGIRSKNYNKCIGGVEFFLFKETMSSAKPLYIFWYDENKAYISNGYKESAGVVTSPLNARFFRLRADEETTSVIICINISKTTGFPKNGDYVPYEEKTYSITQSPLHGLFKLDNDKIVADGDIRKSNGDVTRKYGIVDLGTLSWTRESSGRFTTSGLVGIIPSKSARTVQLVCAKYVAHSNGEAYSADDNGVIYNGADSTIKIQDSNYTDSTTFKTAMSGVYLIYELATPATETTDPYTNPQICDKDGTEEFIDDRTVPIPVGHNSTYANLPSMMDGDFLNYMAKNFASEEYTDRAVEEKADNTTAYVDLPGNYDTTNKNFPTRSATSGSVENCLTYINDLADKLYTAINSHATVLANIPTKTVVVNHRAIDVGDEFNISLPLSYKFLIVELYIYANGECGSIVSTDFANGSVLSIVANGHGSSYWCDLSRMANRITVDGNFDSTHGELTITAF